MARKEFAQNEAKVYRIVYLILKVIMYHRSKREAVGIKYRILDANCRRSPSFATFFSNFPNTSPRIHTFRITKTPCQG
jgi:hypothetical protein